MNMSRKLIIAAVLALCTGTACTRGPTEPKPDGTQFVFKNAGSIPVIEAGASTCDDLSEWPNNLKTPLQPGSSVTIEVYRECWDLHAKFQDGREKIQWAVEMSKGQRYTWNIN
jgi:hypothetical protein